MIANNVPLLNTDITEPLHFLQKHLLENREQISEWLTKEWRMTPPPIYGSVDLRNAGFKVAPIDMNLFPAGFNNLNPAFERLSSTAAKKIIDINQPNTQRILVIPESHTRNLFYWQNVETLMNVLHKAGYEVCLGGFFEGDDPEKIFIDEAKTRHLFVFPLKRNENRLFVDDFIPDMILLNNDLSDGIPPILVNLKQTIVPPAELGWSTRLKSEHFQYYQAVSESFAALIGIDPWLITPFFKHCGEIDFRQQGGLDCIIDNAQALFEEIAGKYKEYNIPYQPFIIVKADAGTYGRAVMTVRDISELRTMNRKQRNRMATTKGGRPVRRVIIQEGVYTFEVLGKEKSVAEPVVYLWGESVVGGFYRLHKNRSVDENLNSPGMFFEPIAFTEPCHEPSTNHDINACQNQFYTYGIIAQLSMLAAAREIKDQRKG